MRPDEGILTIRAALDRACRWYGNHTALAEGTRRLSYTEFGTRLRAIAAGYQRLGVSKGDRVLFLCAASIEHTLAYYAAHCIGAITANLHLREPADVQSGLVKRLAPRILVHDEEYAALVDELLRRHPALVAICTGRAKGAASVALVDLAGDGRAEAALPEISVDDAAIIQLSSGTTGVSKALVHSQRSVLATWSGAIQMWSGISPDDRFLNGFAPPFVVWLVHAGAFLAHGAGVWLQSSWDPKAFLAAVQDSAIRCAALTPTQWRSVLAAQPESYELGSLRMAAYLGEKLESDRLRELMRRVCPEFSSFYGMSECLGLGGCIVRGSDIVQRGKWGSVGRPLPNSDLRIADVRAEGISEKPMGEIGEVVVRSASFALGNWGDPDWQQRVVTSDGWYRTGDLASVDGDGYVHLRGRADNQIATGGIKVLPEEIEQVIAAHDGVAAVAVFGVDDACWGQRIAALVVKRSASLTVDELQDWCRGGGRLASFKCPKEWHFVDALPFTSVGKLDRKALAPLAATLAG